MSDLQLATSARRRVVSLAGCAQVAADHASRNPRLEGVIAMAPRWEWAPALLLALEQSGLIRASARAVGIGTRTAYDKRERDPEFAAAWDTALAPFLHGDGRYDRRPLAAFPAHQALAPFERESAQCGAVTIAELERGLGCSLHEWANELERYADFCETEAGRFRGRRYDVRSARRLNLEFADRYRELASRMRARAPDGNRSNARALLRSAAMTLT